jgi:predicted transcriptional regulator
MNVSIAEIKNYLHKLIVETDDENILSKVQAYFTTLKSENVDWWDTISDQEKEAINIGLQQLENGEGIPHEEVKRKVDKLLGRK